MNKFTLHHGNCLEILKTFPDNHVDSIVTDPPYGLSFMGKKWDYDVPSVEVWAECLRVLKPGGHLLAFAGTRTQHRMAVRIEDAGFEIRDMIAWVYGSGFPKSLDVSKAIDKAAGAEREVVGDKLDRPGYHLHGHDGGEAFGHGIASSTPETRLKAALITAPATPEAQQWAGWGTALKPALEPITVARKPLIGTVSENVLAHGAGALNIDGCRVETSDNCARNPSLVHDTAAGFGKGAAMGGRGHDAGRWPANLIHDGSKEVTDLLGETARFFYCARQDDVLPPEVCHNQIWQDQNQNQSSAPTAGQSLSLLKAVESIVQNAVATWQSLEGILSNAQSGVSTSVTPSELKTINEVVTATIANIGSGFLPAQQLEKPTQCGSRVKCAAMKEPTGITKITTSLCKSGGCVAVVTSTITQTNLERGVAASRFNYCPKASKRDRDEGLDGLKEREKKTLNSFGDQSQYKFPDGAHRVGNKGTSLARNHHPTVKPTDLMRYLCRLVTPPSGIVLDPFMGSGSTGKAALLEGFEFIGIEMNEEYLNISRSRIEYAQKEANSKSTHNCLQPELEGF